MQQELKAQHQRNIEVCARLVEDKKLVIEQQEHREQVESTNQQHRELTHRLFQDCSNTLAELDKQ